MSFLDMLVFYTWWLDHREKARVWPSRKRGRASFWASPISYGSEIQGCMLREAAACSLRACQGNQLSHHGFHLIFLDAVE